jgi:hypothetical protein
LIKYFRCCRERNSGELSQSSSAIRLHPQYDSRIHGELLENSKKRQQTAFMTIAPIKRIRIISVKKLVDEANSSTAIVLKALIEKGDFFEDYFFWGEQDRVIF